MILAFSRTTMTFYKSLIKQVLLIGTISGSIPTIAEAADFLMIPDSNSDRILLFDGNDGSLVDDNFIDGAGLFSTPLNAIQVNNEIWVSDQVADAIFRFDLNGDLLSTITGGLDNIRGMEFVNDTIYVANAGTDNGAPGDGEVVVTFDTAGNNLGFFDTGDPYDILAYNNELLINDINSESTGGEDIDRYDFNGNLLGTFHESNGETGIDFPQQMVEKDNGNLLVAGFSPSGGIYEYDLLGNQVGFFDGNDGIAFRGIRGVYELGDGNILWTGGDGVVTTDLTTGDFTDIFTVNTPDLLPELDYRPSARYIEKVSLPDESTAVPEPVSIVSLLSLGVLAILSRLNLYSKF